MRARCAHGARTVQATPPMANTWYHHYRLLPNREGVKVWATSITFATPSLVLTPCLLSTLCGKFLGIGAGGGGVLQRQGHMKLQLYLLSSLNAKSCF